MKICCRCGKKGKQTWNICSDNNKKRYVCNKCDIELNVMILIFMGFRNWRSKISAYERIIKC